MKRIIDRSILLPGPATSTKTSGIGLAWRRMRLKLKGGGFVVEEKKWSNVHSRAAIAYSLSSMPITITGFSVAAIGAIPLWSGFNWEKEEDHCFLFLFPFLLSSEIVVYVAGFVSIVSHKKGTTSYMSPKYFDTSANVAWLPLYRDIKIYSAIMKNLYGRANILMGNKINLGHV